MDVVASAEVEVEEDEEDTGVSRVKCTPARPLTCRSSRPGARMRLGREIVVVVVLLLVVVSVAVEVVSLLLLPG